MRVHSGLLMLTGEQCDLDPTSNGLALTGQIPLTVTGDNVPGVNGLSQEKEKDFNITVQMPADLKCIGGELPVKTVSQG